MSKKIIGSAAIYIGGEIVNKAIPFLLLPFLTAFLSPHDFGVIATYQAVLQVFFVIVSLSMQASITVLFFKLNDSLFKKVLSSICILSIFSAVIVTLFIAVFKRNIVVFLGVDPFWVLVLPLIVLFQSFSQYLIVFYQVRKMQQRYVTFQLLNTLVNVSVSVALIAYWHIGLEGRIAGIAVAALIFGLWSLFNLKTNNQFDFKTNKDSFLIPLRFSLPLIPHSLSNWIKTSVDRVFLMSFLGASVVGGYAVMYQLAMILSVIFMATNKALIPYLFETLKKDVYETKIIQSWCIKIAIIIIVLSISFILIIPFIFNFIINANYKFQYSLVTLLILGFMFQGLYLLLINFLMFYEKTKLIAKIAIISSLLHLSLTFPLIFFYGSFGAAVANCISWFILFLLVFYFGSKSKSYPWNLK